MRLPPALSCLLLILGLSVSAAAPAVADAPVTLLRPRAGEVLTAGSLGIVEWSGDDGFPGPAVEEWEAFLSFDDGGYYAVRITPHLDVSLRRFTFRVPQLPTPRARILLRFGDEVREVGFEMPQRFAIALPRQQVLSFSRTTLLRGEPARPGEPGVVAWVEGSRSGEGLVTVATLPTAPVTGPTARQGIPRLMAATTPRVPQPGTEPVRWEGSAPVRTTLPASFATPSPQAPDLRLLCRQNE